MTDKHDWDGIDPPIISLGFGLIWQAFCTKGDTPEKVVELANKHCHPGTSNGWVWPSDESYQTWCDANNEKWGDKLDKLFTIEELKNGIPCQARLETHKHYILHC